jgi:hypothetical protein
MSDQKWIKAGAAAGMVGPALFGGVLVGLTVLEYDFMRSLGWSPLAAPTFDWPSGLALGPYGAVMTATFVLAGLLMGVFGLGLRQALGRRPGGQAASGLMMLAGLAMLGLASPADPTLRSTPATLAGNLHDLSYVFLGLALFPAMLLMGRVFRRQPGWGDLALFTWLVAGLAIPSFALKGLAIYLFLAAVLVWCERVALRLWRSGAG